MLGLPIVAITLVLVTVMNLTVFAVIRASVSAEVQRLGVGSLDGHVPWGTACAVVLPLVAALTLFAFRRPLGMAAAAGILRLRLCPACGYSLAGSPTGGDGSCVCAECGGTWRVENVTEDNHP